MNNSESEHDTSTKTYPLVIEEDQQGEWEDWKKTVPWTYSSVGDRILEFVERDLHSRQETNQELLEQIEHLENRVAELENES